MREENALDPSRRLVPEELHDVAIYVEPERWEDHPALSFDDGNLAIDVHRGDLVNLLRLDLALGALLRLDGRTGGGRSGSLGRSDEDGPGGEELRRDEDGDRVASPERERRRARDESQGGFAGELGARGFL